MEKGGNVSKMRIVYGAIAVVAILAVIIGDVALFSKIDVIEGAVALKGTITIVSVIIVLCTAAAAVVMFKTLQNEEKV